MTTILHKRGIGIPSADDLSVGELALDTSAGTAYTKLSNGTVVEIGGSGDSYDDTQIRDDLAKETQDRIDGDDALQNQIDGLSGGGGGGAWTLVEKFAASSVSAFEVELPTDQYQKVRVVWHWKADPQNTMRTIAMRAKRGGSYISTKDQYRTQIAYTDSANGTWKWWQLKDRNGEIPLSAIGGSGGTVVIELDYANAIDKVNFFIETWLGRTSGNWPEKQIIPAEVLAGSGRGEALNVYGNGNMSGTIYVEALEEA